jgi:hypothetical protein
MKAYIMWFIFVIVLPISGYALGVYHAINELNEYKSRSIDKQQYIPLPSSNVNEYWACKKEVNK